MNPCPICEEQSQISRVGSSDANSVKCPRCGNYNIVRTALVNIKNTRLTARQRANISGWLSENQVFEITRQKLEILLFLPSPSFHERADKVLLSIEKNTEYAGQFLRREKRWISWGWCVNEDEIEEILQYLESTSRILKRSTGDRAYKIVPTGWAHLEEIKKVNSDSNQCFVAMWFDDRMQNTYDNAISKGILDAGYKPHRVDQREYNDKIDDEIIVQIRRSHFIVADFTGHRGGVYYEAGFAKGLGLEVIFTCRKDDMENLHFDIRQYNCIDWEEDKFPDFRKNLSNRIERTLGRGNYQQN